MEQSGRPQRRNCKAIKREWSELAPEVVHVDEWVGEQWPVCGARRRARPRKTGDRWMGGWGEATPYGRHQFDENKTEEAEVIEEQDTVQAIRRPNLKILRKLQQAVVPGKVPSHYEQNAIWVKEEITGPGERPTVPDWEDVAIRLESMLSMVGALTERLKAISTEVEGMRRRPESQGLTS